MSAAPPTGSVQWIAWFYAHRWAFLYRLGVSVLLLSWLKLFPHYLLTLYLGHYGIPPFELAGDDMPGANIILVWTLMVLVIGGIYLWLPFILLVLRTFYFKTSEAESQAAAPQSAVAAAAHSKPLRRFAAFLSTLLIALLLLMMFGAGRMEWTRLFYFALLSFVLVVSAFLFFRRNLSESIVNWRGPLIFVFLSVLVPIAAQPAVVATLDATFRTYRVGGGLPVYVERFGDTTTSIRGRLLLLGKRNIYIETEAGTERKLTIITNTENLVVTVGADKGSRETPLSGVSP